MASESLHELPPGFWDSDPEPQAPAAPPQPEVRRQPAGRAAARRPATAAPDPQAAVPPAVLEIFPGRVVARQEKAPVSLEISEEPVPEPEESEAD